MSDIMSPCLIELLSECTAELTVIVLAARGTCPLGRPYYLRMLMLVINNTAFAYAHDSDTLCRLVIKLIPVRLSAS